MRALKGFARLVEKCSDKDPSLDMTKPRALAGVESMLRHFDLDQETYDTLVRFMTNRNCLGGGKVGEKGDSARFLFWSAWHGGADAECMDEYNPSRIS